MHSPELEYVYPLLAYDPSRTYMRPEYLARKIRFKVEDPLPEKSIHELGYFRKVLITSKFAGDELDQITESEIGGLSWAILEPENVDKVKVELARFIKVAASYGADAIVDVALYFEGECSSCENTGLFISGTVIAFDE